MRCLRLFTTAAALCWAAQSAAQVPSTVEPGRLQPLPNLLPTLPKQDRSLQRQVMPVAPEVESPGLQNEINFRLVFVVVEGATAFRMEDFVPLYEEYLQQNISFTELSTIAERVTQKYRDSGYLLAQTIIPQQKILNGVVYLRVQEGSIDRVVLSDEDTMVISPLPQMSEKIGRMRPINSKSLQRYLLLMNDLPGVSLKTQLAQSRFGSGYADSVLEMHHDKWQGSVGIDNRNSRYFGPWQWNGAVAANAVLGHYDQLGLSLSGGFDREEIEGIAAYYDMPLGSEGTRLQLSGSYTGSQPGSRLKDLQIISTSRAAALQVSHPLRRSLRESLYVYGRFDYENSHTNSLGLRLSRDELRSLRAGLNYNYDHPSGTIYTAGVQLSQGFEFLGAGDPGQNRTRARGRPDYTKLTLDGGLLTRLADTLNLSVQTTAQYAGTVLLSGEEFGYGGGRFGRGYDASEITGEHGAAAALELQWFPQFLQGRRVGTGLYVFGDAGVVWNRDSDSQDARKAATSAGFGARLSLPYNINGELELAQPIGQGVAAEEPQGNNPRIFVNFSKSF